MRAQGSPAPCRGWGRQSSQSSSTKGRRDPSPRGRLAMSGGTCRVDPMARSSSPRLAAAGDTSDLAESSGTFFGRRRRGRDASKEPSPMQKTGSGKEAASAAPTTGARLRRNFKEGISPRWSQKSPKDATGSPPPSPPSPLPAAAPTEGQPAAAETPPNDPAAERAAAAAAAFKRLMKKADPSPDAKPAKHADSGDAPASAPAADTDDQAAAPADDAPDDVARGYCSHPQSMTWSGLSPR